MAWGAIIIRVAACVLAGLVVFAPSFPARADQCDEATIGECLPDHTEVTALAWIDGEFIGVGARENGLDLLHVSASGELIEAETLDLPRWITGAAPAASARIDKIVPGPDGALLLVGSAPLSANGQLLQQGLLGRRSADGTVGWAPPIKLLPDTSVIFYSAVYDAANNRYMVVGRHTNGSDSGHCTAWSQSIAIVVPDGDLSGRYRYSLLGEQAPGPYNRSAFYDIVPMATPGEFMLTGFGTAPAPSGGRCQDNAIYIHAAFSDEKGWAWLGGSLVGEASSGEVAFAIAPAADGNYAIAGYGTDPRSDTRGALAILVSPTGSPPDMHHLPYPPDGSDKTGGDRFRVLVPIESGTALLAAGSASTSRSARNQAFWQVLGLSLDPRRPPELLTTEIGSDIEAAATGPDGRVLAGGLHRTSDGQEGWIGIIQKGLSLAERRAPDASLLALSPAEKKKGYLEFSTREIAAGTGYRTRDVAADSVFEARFSLGEQTDMAVSALAVGGEIDIALLDGQGRIVAVSDNVEEAGEFIGERLEAGDYRVLVVAATDVGEYELRVGHAPFSQDEMIDRLMGLEPQLRHSLDVALHEGGYGATSNASIGYGAAGVDAIVALANTRQSVLDVNSVMQFVATAAGVSLDQ